MKQRVKDFFAGIVTATVIEMLLTDAVTEMGLNPTEKVALALTSLFVIYLFFFHSWQRKKRGSTAPWKLIAVVAAVVIALAVWMPMQAVIPGFEGLDAGVEGAPSLPPGGG